MDGWMDKWMDGRMEGWVGGWMDGLPQWGGRGHSPLMLASGGSARTHFIPSRPVVALRWWRSLGRLFVCSRHRDGQWSYCLSISVAGSARTHGMHGCQSAGTMRALVEDSGGG